MRPAPWSEACAAQILVKMHTQVGVSGLGFGAGNLPVTPSFLRLPLCHGWPRVSISLPESLLRRLFLAVEVCFT